MMSHYFSSLPAGHGGSMLHQRIVQVAVAGVVLVQWCHHLTWQQLEFMRLSYSQWQAYALVLIF